MQKIGRNYSLLITLDNNGVKTPIQISLPYTIEFDITRNTLTSANVFSIRLYNLSPATRNVLRRNVVAGFSLPLIDVILRAGYTGNSTALKGSTQSLSQLPIICSGNVYEAWSVREGVNYITQLECYDAGYTFVNAQIPPSLATIPKGTPYKTLIGNLIQSMSPYVTLGAVGNYPGSTPKQITLSGSTIEALKQFTGGGFFIDNGIGNALGNSEYSLAYPPVLVNSSTGLLNTPVFENNLLRFDMMFEPALNVGGSAQVQALNYYKNQKNVNPPFNGQWKITSVKHRGMISPTVCGEVITTGEFFFLKNSVSVQSHASS